MQADFDKLRSGLAGEVRTDALSRTLYATDASIYELLPEAVVLPRSVDDVVHTVQWCAAQGLPLTARGAGTGLTGAAINRGVILDCSRFLNRVRRVDAEQQTAWVEPGVVLDELNAQLRPHGLQFAPDVATSSRATIGGMIAVNSCGAHSILYGRTVDHVRSLDLVLADGSQATVGADTGQHDSPRLHEVERTLCRLHHELRDEIAARYPHVKRSNGGYAFDRLRVAGGRPNVESIVCGSEGTLAVVVGAQLKLEPLPACRGLAIIQFDTVLAALEALPAILKHTPAAIELIDDTILEATKNNPAMARRRWFLEGDPAALLACEVFADDQDTLRNRLKMLHADLESQAIGSSRRLIESATEQEDVWAVRKAGLGLLMSQPGPRQPYAFIEDAAVDPARLPEYVRRLDALLAEEGVEQTGHYAHASVGCLHVRPVLNLRDVNDVQRMRRIAERVSSLVLEFGGTMSGEHGDGIVRSVWLEKIYGPRIIEGFRQLKQAFDPQGILNPGKVVDPLRMTENLRFGAEYEPQDIKTTLDFSRFGGLAGLAEMCTGVGQCRQRLVGTMCPSFMATGDETHSTRARANALRVALSNRGLLNGLTDPALDEVMDLCLSCKACQTECPTGVDMARLKAEWLAERNRRQGVPRRSRLIAASVDWATWGSHFAPLSNWVMQSRVTRVLLEHLFGMDRRVPPPRFAKPTFRQWFAQREQSTEVTAEPVVYFVDTWTNFYEPQVGQAVVRVLEALGRRVLVPDTRCCGRPLISKGMLDEARKLAEANVRVLGPYVERGIPIVGSEPSCVSALADELPQMVRNHAAQALARHMMPVETFVMTELRGRPDALTFKQDLQPVLYHGHCHDKARTGTADGVALLQACTRGQATEIDSGCCGMAGAFGHEVEHYDVARAIGEQRLFPAVRNRGHAEVAAGGFSCRQHIAQHTDTHARHLIEVVAAALT